MTFNKEMLMYIVELAGDKELLATNGKLELFLNRYPDTATTRKELRRLSVLKFIGFVETNIIYDIIVNQKAKDFVANRCG